MFKPSWRITCTKFGERKGTALSTLAQGSKNDALKISEVHKVVTIVRC